MTPNQERRDDQYRDFRKLVEEERTGLNTDEQAGYLLGVRDTIRYVTLRRKYEEHLRRVLGSDEATQQFLASEARG